MTISGHFFANYMFIFHKTEIQTVILRCLTSLNLNLYKNHDTKRKNTKNANVCFCTKSKKLEMEIFTFEPIRIQTRYAPQNDCLNLSFVKDELTYGKKMARNGRKTVIYEEHSFQISLYVPGQLYQNLRILINRIHQKRK